MTTHTTTDSIVKSSLPTRKKMIVANWKMNCTRYESVRLAQTIQDYLSLPEKNFSALATKTQIEVILAPTHLHIDAVGKVIQDSWLTLAAQNVFPQSFGAYTGEVSAPMLKEFNVDYCIIGHSERRMHLQEKDIFIRLKVEKLLEEGIRPVVCVGETVSQRESGRWQEVISQQVQVALDQIDSLSLPLVVIAYEPLWAIGTGVKVEAQQVQEVHQYIRNLCVKGQSIIYGGSVNAQNSTELFQKPDIDGVLVGGASLHSQDFLAIVENCFSLIGKNNS